MRFKGNKVGRDVIAADGTPKPLSPGVVMGPGNDGLYREVTDVWFDEIDGHTYLDTEIVDPTPSGENTRYYGGVDPNTPVPETRERIVHEVRPR